MTSSLGCRSAPSISSCSTSACMVSRSSGEVSSDRTSRSFRRRLLSAKGRGPAAIRERNACSGTDDVSQVMALATSAEQVDLYHFFTNMQVWAICQDQCEYHTIQKAETVGTSHEEIKEVHQRRHAQDWQGPSTPKMFIARFIALERRSMQIRKRPQLQLPNISIPCICVAI